MTRLVVYVIVSVGLLAAAAVGWRYYTHTQVVRVEVQPAPQSMPASPAPRPIPDHGDFQKRFQPTPPPPNGGRFN